MKKYKEKEIIKEVFWDDLTLKEFSGIVDKSIRTISRKISQGKIHPKVIKSKCGTTEYIFNNDNIKAFLYDELPKRSR